MGEKLPGKLSSVLWIANYSSRWIFLSWSRRSRRLIEQTVMFPPDDAQLLRAWIAERDESAFRALVDRYAGLVHGAALRRAGDADLAAEAAQDVFVRLAKHAASIRRAEALPAWLHAAAVHAAADRVRAESRHRERMKRLYDENTGSGQENEAWRDALPLLDEAIARLGETDRGLVLARYCQGESVASAARKFGLSPAAAQKRGERALEKLAHMLRRRGVVLSAAALAAGMVPRVSHAAPAGVAAKCSAVALAASTSSAGSAAWFAFMNAKAVSIAAAVAAFCVPVGMHLHASSRPRALPAVPAPGVASLPGGDVSAAVPKATASPPADAAVDLAALERGIRSFPPRTERLKRELELRRMVQSLDAAECAVAAEWLAEAPGADTLRRVSDDLYRRWASLDREQALAAAIAMEDRKPGTSAQFAVFAWWADADPADALERFTPDLKGDGRAKESARRACQDALRSLALTDPRSAIAAAQQHAPEGDSAFFMTQALTGWAQGASPGEPLAWLATVEDATDRTNWYRGFMGVLQDWQPDKAWASLLTWPDRVVAQDHACSTLNMWAVHDPDAAVAAWLAGPEAWRTKHFASNLAQVLSYANPDAATRLANDLPDPAMREHFSAAAKKITGMEMIPKKP